MKKIYFCCLIFLFIFGMGFVTSPNVYAEQTDSNDFIEIETAEQFMSMSENGNYILANDITFENNFVPITTFMGTLDGNGYTLHNININNQSSNVAIFEKTIGANIYDLQIDNIKVNISQSSEEYITKTAFLVAEAVSTNIENCAIVELEGVDTTSENKLFVSSKSSIYCGSLVADAKSGTSIKNCIVYGDLEVNGNNLPKSYKIGGLFGNFENSTAYNIINNANVTAFNLNSFTAQIGGVFGSVLGNKTEIKNVINDASISDENLDSNLNISSFIGSISCPSDCPIKDSINYFYTNLDIDYIGNTDELNLYYQNGLTGFDVNSLTLVTMSESSFKLKDFYLNEESFDKKREWDFNKIWQINEKISLPFLQVFSTFSYSVNEDASFSSLVKPNIDSNVIDFVNFDVTNSFRYNGTIELGGSITDDYQINKFYEISGIRKDGEILFLNSTVTDILQNKNVIVTEIDENSKTYTIDNSDIVVTEKKEVFNGNTGTLYSINNSDISWGLYSNSVSENVNVYVIDNCTLLNQGEYSFVLEPIKYELVVSTEDIAHGSIRRATADSSVKKDIIVEEVFYGQNLGYVATPTDDFAFNAWYINNESENPLSETATLSTKFDETAFLEGRIFYGIDLGEENSNLTLLATFTKNVCDITIKFAVNGKIGDDVLSKIYFDNVELTATNGEFVKKVKLGTTHTVKVILPAGYEFTSWFYSDGTSNLGSASNELEATITADSEETLVLVADFFKEENIIDANSWIWWVIGGSVALLAIIGITIYIVIKKRKDNSYKNYYY